MGTKQQNKQQSKHKSRVIKSGEMMQGICMQWFIDTYGFSNNGKVNGFELYTAILRKTFGYRQRYNYIKQDFFQMSPNKIKRHRDKLTELGIIEWRTTKGLTYYRILEPKKEIETFIFVKNKDENKNTKENKEEEFSPMEMIQKYM
jgi:hypothetical protein